MLRCLLADLDEEEPRQQKVPTDMTEERGRSGEIRAAIKAVWDAEQRDKDAMIHQLMGKFYAEATANEIRDELKRVAIDRSLALRDGQLTDGSTNPQVMKYAFPDLDTDSVVEQLKRKRPVYHKTVSRSGTVQRRELLFRVICYINNAHGE